MLSLFLEMLSKSLKLILTKIQSANQEDYIGKNKCSIQD